MSKSKNKLYCQMINNQIDDVSDEWKLKPSDILRICKYIDTSIFDSSECCIWKGYISNSDNIKGSYINFYFNKNKVILHRLLYQNYVEELNDDEYIKFTCDNKGICCNINHYKKKKYTTSKIKKHKVNDDDNVIMITGNLTIE